jgi:hypothetical protein
LGEEHASTWRMMLIKVAARIQVGHSVSSPFVNVVAAHFAISPDSGYAILA